jgi:molybdenum cofactor cytidylyltransferase
VRAAVILAAGAGARLGGRNKAALRLPDGRAFVEVVIGAAREAGVDRVVVVVGGPHEAETRALAAGAEIAVNREPERGMLSSLLAGLDVLGSADVALVWPVDHPRVRVATARLVLERAGRDRVVVPTFHGRGGHPSAFGAELFPALRAAATAREASAGRAERVEVDDEGVVRDVDTVEDLP